MSDRHNPEAVLLFTMLPILLVVALGFLDLLHQKNGEHDKPQATKRRQLYSNYPAAAEQNQDGPSNNTRAKTAEKAAVMAKEEADRVYFAMYNDMHGYPG